MMSVQHSFNFLIKGWCLSLMFLVFSVLPVLADPSYILKQPRDTTICEQQDYVRFFVTLQANLVGDYSFRWYKKVNSDWEAISDATGGSREFWAQPSTATYRCIVSKTLTEYEISREVTLTVHKAPQITGIDVKAVCSGEEIVASAIGVNTNGSNLKSFVWKLPLISGGEISFGNTTTGDVVPNWTFTSNSAEHNNQFLTITVENACGSTTYPSLPYYKTVTVHPLPPLPTPVVKNYCQGENAQTLDIDSDNKAVWYNMNREIIPAPTPKTDVPGLQKWWVMQIRTNDDGSTCASDTVLAKVNIFPIPAPPERDANIFLCINDPGITLEPATGVKWYNDMKKTLATAPQINTSRVETQTYYVTKNNGECESSIDDGKVTVVIKDRANADNIVLSYNPELCPNSSSIILAEANVTNPIFRWYTFSDKTGEINTGPGNGSIFETVELKKDTAYYVSIQYGDLCESIYAQAAVFNVRDIIPPEFRDSSYAHPLSILPQVVVNTIDRQCHASVQLEKPRVYDNCTDEPNLVISLGTNDVTFPLAASDFQLGDSTLIWWVRDEAGNADYSLQTISVRDRQRPWPTQPVQDVIKEIDEHENSAIVYYDWKYEDNCTPASELIDSLYRGKESGSVFPLGETEIIRYIIDKAGNVDTCRFKVIVKHPYRKLEVSLRVSANPICKGKEVVITPVTSGGTGEIKYLWNPRSWTAPVMRDYPTRNTTYEVTVRDDSTTVTIAVPVTVLDTRPVSLSLSVEGRPVSMDEIFEGDEVLVSATSGFDAYKLLLNNVTIQEVGINNYLSFQANLGTYVVKVFATDENFCVTDNQMIIEVESKKLPNVFTPNFDGKNDLFLEFLEIPHAPKDFELTILSQAGELLYKGNRGWDGIYKGKVMPQGTYLYIARRKMNNGEFRTFRGHVTLKL